MSIVSVHGPNQWGGTGAAGGGSGATVTAPQVKATADMDEGLKFTFEASDKTRPAADYDWAFPGGTPVSQADSHGPITVTYATGGQKTATLTIAAGAGPPAGGAYPITVTALTAGPRSLKDDEPEADQQGASPPPVEPELDPGYDPADFTVQEVTEYAQTLEVEQIKELLAKEEAGKNRSTLVTALGELLPFDPADFTVQEVEDYIAAYPDEREAVLELEREGKARTTLLAFLEQEPEEES